MTATEMMYEAELIYESIASQDARGYEPREWSVMLTQAQSNIVRDLCAQGFDRDETNRQKVGKLIKYISVEAFAAVDNLDNAWKVDEVFPTDYRYRASGRVNTSTLSHVKVVPKTHQEYDTNISNPFRKPYEEEFWLLTNEDQHIIITNGETPTKYFIEYVRHPKPIIVETLSSGQEIEGELVQADCELNTITHRDIVKEAAKLAYAYLKDQLGYEIQKAENQ